MFLQRQEHKARKLRVFLRSLHQQECPWVIWLQMPRPAHSTAPAPRLPLASSSPAREQFHSFPFHVRSKRQLGAVSGPRVAWTRDHNPKRDAAPAVEWLATRWSRQDLPWRAWAMTKDRRGRQPASQEAGTCGALRRGAGRMASCAVLGVEELVSTATTGTSPNWA